MNHLFQSIFISVLLICTRSTFAMDHQASMIGSPNPFAMYTTNTSPINSACDIEDDFDIKALPTQYGDVRLDEDAIVPTQCAEAVLHTKADLAITQTEACRITRAAVKSEDGRVLLNFPEVRSSFIKNSDAHYQSFLIAHQALTMIVSCQERKSVLENALQILALHNEITRELIIRNNQNPKPHLSNVICSYKLATDLMCLKISRGFSSAETKMKHQARHTWGECDCDAFPVDPL
jgi:hypothetical protein